MANIYWLTETGEVALQPAGSVDFSDEGKAVDFAHHLYRSDLESTPGRQGFIIRSDEGRRLYTWRWTGETVEVPRPESEALPAPRRATSRLKFRLPEERTPATIGATRDEVVSDRAAGTPKRRAEPVREAAPKTAKVFTRLGVLARLATVFWRSVTQWERSHEPAVPRGFRPAERPKIRLKTRRAG